MTGIKKDVDWVAREKHSSPVRKTGKKNGDKYL